MNLEDYLAYKRQIIDKTLDDLLPREDNDAALLHSAMRYSVFAGGKRIRPILAMASAEAVGGTEESVLPLAAALECVHTYSLIHDDLPAMDDDDLRRGKPTAHKIFGEAIAILAGDALLTFAFEILSSPWAVRLYRAERLLAAIRELAVAAGPMKLVAGQALDILNEGKEIKEEIVDSVVRAKTAALMRASLACGALLAGGDSLQIEILGRYGECLGIAFQIRDDILDLEGDPIKLGKNVRKDESRGKPTYPTLLGKEQAKKMMFQLLDSAMEAIEPLGPKAEPLVVISKYLGERIS
ncbi:MAG: polyprenyl synthetase family protein [Desulfomonilaceae bacterium]